MGKTVTYEILIYGPDKFVYAEMKTLGKKTAYRICRLLRQIGFKVEVRERVETVEKEVRVRTCKVRPLKTKRE